MNTLLQDLRYSFRTLGRKPGFIILAVLILALGIGANNSIFGMVNAVILRPLPGVPDSDELVMLVGRTRAGNDTTVSYPDYKDYRDQNEIFSGLIASNPFPFSMKVDDDDPERIWGELVSGNYFQVLGVQAALGRLLFPEDDLVPGGHPVAVLSYGLWQRRFGGDPAILGRSIVLESHSFTVVGVTQEGFQGSVVALQLDIYIPITMTPAAGPRHVRGFLESRDSRWLILLGRLKPGIGLKQGEASVKTLAAHLRQEYPDVNEGSTVALYPLWRAPIGGQSFLVPVVTILSLAVGLVLLIACSNVANLLLARAAARRQEVAIRLSLGASRFRLVRQFLTESILVALLAGVVGLLFSLWIGDFISALMPRSTLPTTLVVTKDNVVLGFTLLISLLTGILFGLAPALHGTKLDVVSALKDGGSRQGPRGSRLRDFLVVSQVAMSLVGLIAAGLLLQSTREARQVNPGFDPEKVLLVSVDVTPGGYEENEGRTFYRQLLERVEGLPGVESATLSSRLPLGIAGHPSQKIEFEGYQPQPDELMTAHYNLVGPRYLGTLRIPLVEGRDFTLQDTEDTRSVVVINEAMASRYGPGQSPLGKRLRVGDDWKEIVGVARTAKYESLSEEPMPYFYLPFLQTFRNVMTLHVRTAGDPLAWQDAVKSEVHRLNANLPVFDVRTMHAQIDEELSQYHMAASMLVVLGAQGLLMALVGLFGLMVYAVNRRTPELGIRMALGAQSRDVFRLVVMQGMRLVLFGVLAGMVGAIALGRAVSGLFFGVSPTDPLTFVSVPLLLTAVALLACYVPARRATKIDPMVALRYE